MQSGTRHLVKNIKSLGPTEVEQKGGYTFHFSKSQFNTLFWWFQLLSVVANTKFFPCHSCFPHPLDPHSVPFSLNFQQSMPPSLLAEVFHSKKLTRGLLVYFSRERPLLAGNVPPKVRSALCHSHTCLFSVIALGWHLVQIPPGHGGCSVHPGLILQLVSSRTVNLPLLCSERQMVNTDYITTKTNGRCCNMVWVVFMKN